MIHRLSCLVPTLVMLVVMVGPATGQGQSSTPGPLIPDRTPLDELVTTALREPFLTDEERRAMRVFHGVWDEHDLTTPEARATVALNAWDLNHPSLLDNRTPVELRARARLLAGDLEESLALLEGIESISAHVLRAEALLALGREDAAVDEAHAAVQWMQRIDVERAEDLTASVQAMYLLTRLEAQPSARVHDMIEDLSRAHQLIDRLYWPARLVEGRILRDKHNRRQAVEAFHEVIGLNPRCAEAWYGLGLIALRSFDFDSAAAAAERLRRIHPEHPLAVLLLAEKRIVEDDPEEAIELLDVLLHHRPRFLPGLAMLAAARGTAFDWDGMQRALDQYEAVSPGSAEPYQLAGLHLSRKRQYERATTLLEEAIQRAPAWSAPRTELGLLAMQAGRDHDATAILRQASSMDPFNKRAANSLFLIEELLTYAHVQTEHFDVRYRPGIDEALVSLVLERFDDIYETVTTYFEHEPAQRTLIELMPDHSRFAVRITGQPDIYTYAACTGPIVAMEVPREGARGEHTGLYDLPRVLRHEFTHAVTLDQTQNRIPHWLTEGAAVEMELAPRTYSWCRLLATAYHNDDLFTLDEINWGFIRPRRRNDRAKAYAQSQWMLQFMEQRYGRAAIVRVLEQFRDGVPQDEAVAIAFGVPPEAFMATFLEWAGDEVDAWGMAPLPSMTTLTDEIRLADTELAAMMVASRKARLDVVARTIVRRAGHPSSLRHRPFVAADWPDLVRPPVTVSDEQLAAWRGRFPEHPDLLELELRRRIDRSETIDPPLAALLRQYALLRPVDPFPHKKLARYHLDAGQPQAAIEHLEYLDVRTDDSPVYAVELARIYRVAGDRNRALDKITRALTIDPYDAATRELASAIAIESRRLDIARQHLVALSLIEPDRQQHHTRLQRLDQIISTRDKTGGDG